jgi:hypothetical protein
VGGEIVGKEVPAQGSWPNQLAEEIGIVKAIR